MVDSAYFACSSVERYKHRFSSSLSFRCGLFFVTSLFFLFLISFLFFFLFFFFWPFFRFFPFFKPPWSFSGMTNFFFFAGACPLKNPSRDNPLHGSLSLRE